MTKSEEGVTAAGRELLGAMRIVRDKIVRVRANDDMFEKAQALRDAIDDVAGEITGRRDYFCAGDARNVLQGYRGGGG